MFIETVRQFERARSAGMTPCNALRARLASARRAFTTRNVDFSNVHALDRSVAPRAGDLVLARVMTIGQHQRLESPEGRRQCLYPGDEIIVAYGQRYAPDQFDALVPDDLSACDLVAGGGIAATMRAKHQRMRNPTRIEPIGLLADILGNIVNLNDYRTISAQPHNSQCHVIAIVGTSMNAGKTTTAATLIHGLNRAGLRVGAAKLTGTGSGGDIWSMLDAGARVAFDFTDVGHATTAGVAIPGLIDDSLALIAAASRGHDIAVVEIADGLFQQETAALLQSPNLMARIDKIVLAAGDAMGAAFGHQWLKRRGLPVSLIAGCVSSSPLGLQEAQLATGLPVATLAELADPEAAPRFAFAEACCEPNRPLSAAISGIA